MQSNGEKKNYKNNILGKLSIDLFSFSVCFQLCLTVIEVLVEAMPVISIHFSLSKWHHVVFNIAIFNIYLNIKLLILSL